jgi:hypothetical protein
MSALGHKQTCVTGVVASKLIANLEGKKAAAPGPAKKKRKTKAK